MKAWTGVVLLALALTGRAGETFGPGVRVSGVSAEAMAVDAEGDRLYVAAGTRLSVLDISRPLEPIVLGELEGVDNRRQLVVRNGFVYLVSRETGLRIVDCTDPRRPRLRSRFDTVEFATGIEVVGRTAFVSERINGVEVVDVSDPDRPAHVAIRKTGESQSSRYLDGYLYSGEWGVGDVTVFDARDLGSFREVARLQLHGFGDGRLVVLTARSARRAALYDFSDVEHPKLLRNWTLAGNPDAAAFCGTRVLIPAGHQGLLMTRSAASADCATFCYNIRQPSQGE